MTRRYDIGPGVTRAVHGLPYERGPGDPLYRPLRIYTLDPSASRAEFPVARLKIPYEPLDPGPCGRLFAVDDTCGSHRNEPIDLEDVRLAMCEGYEPSPSQIQFHQQMVYAVCSSVYATFRYALGRPVAWGFDERTDSPFPNQLVIRPHGTQDRNAYYDKQKGELVFGYFRADETVLGNNLPRGSIFTCLSHDIVVHELTHALLDGLRSEFERPTSADVLAFHEAFADLVAFFQRFSYAEVVRAALKASRGKLLRAPQLIDLATQFAQTIGAGQALRRALDIGSTEADFAQRRNDPEPHRRGSLLVAAVVDAFDRIYRKKIDTHLRLATNGTCELPRGELSNDLLEALAKEIRELANQFLAILIRAIDYCPPVDVQFGEYLRALITADHQLVPDDPWGYREALVGAFRCRGIYPPGVDDLSEDSLLWRPPPRSIHCERLSFARLRFRGDPSNPADGDELRGQADALGELVSNPENLDLFGLVEPGTGGADRPCVQSIRSTRRGGPDGQVLFDLVAEVTQRRTAKAADGRPFDFYGGATVIFGPEGDVRYTVCKRVDHAVREASARDFIANEGKGYWQIRNGHWETAPQSFRRLHEGRFERART
ncbi:MAG TPA: peptidase M4 [Thermoanaerobaculia bacterium]|jgi:hypothetical protein|nr:peptidase M4 [Thermoanaerobaculia bacterium]